MRDASPVGASACDVSAYCPSSAFRSIVNIQRQPGANIINVVDRIQNLLPQLKASLPSSVQVSILTDRTTTIRASVKDVQFELMLTVALVVMVIFLFLRSLAATSIPSVAVSMDCSALMMLSRLLF